MKQINWIFFLLLIIFGQLTKMVWPLTSYGGLVFRSLTMAFAIKIMGDILGRFVFKFPNYDWIYLRDYLLNELFGSIGYYVAFVIVWHVPIIISLEWYGYETLLMKIWSSGLMPAVFYMIMHYVNIVSGPNDKKRLRRKIR